MDSAGLNLKNGRGGRLGWGAAVGILFLCVLFPLSHGAAGQTATIEEVGIQGYFTTDNTPTRVRLELSNPGAQSTSFDLTLAVSEKNVPFSRVDRFRFSAALQAGETRQLDLPLPIFAAQPVLTLTASTADGKVVASQTRDLQRINSNALVLLLCADDKTCNEVLGTIEASGNDELKTRKTQKYTFLVLKELPEEWWAYWPAHSVVLARPASGLSAAQRAALAGFCRQRGQLALLEGLVGPGLMDAYRSGSETRMAVGTGWLLRFRDVDELAGFFDRSVSEFPTSDVAKAYSQYNRSLWYRFGNSGNQLATVFDFPTLGWLMFWLVLYIVIVGVVNFYVLTKVNRRELAWITVPAIALAFALMFYLTSAAKRPSKAGLDEIAIYQMDDLDPQASASYQLRVSSPVRQTLALTVPGDAIWAGTDQISKMTATFSVFDRRDANLGEGWSVRLAPNREFAVPLLQWSYQDLNFQGLATLPGSLKSLPNGNLVNQTGLSFRQAVFRDGADIYDLDAVGAGAEFAPHKGTAEESKRYLDTGPYFLRSKTFDRKSHEDIKWLLARETNAGGRVFAGLAESPSLGASLGTRDYARQQYVLVVVTMKAKP